MLPGHQRITWRKNIAENLNRLSRVHERYRRQTDRRQTTDDRRQTDARRHIANMNMSSRSLIKKSTRDGNFIPTPPIPLKRRVSVLACGVVCWT